MINFAPVNYYAPILVMLISFILVYIGLIMLKIPGSKWVLAVLSFIISLILASSKSCVNYIYGIIPYLTVLMIVAFVILLVLAFVAKDIGVFQKPLAIIGCILAVLIVLGMAFHAFPTLNHLLPESSDSGLSHNMEEFKDFIYSPDFKDGLIFVISIVVVGFFLLKAK